MSGGRDPDELAARMARERAGLARKVRALRAEIAAAGIDVGVGAKQTVSPALNLLDRAGKVIHRHPVVVGMAVAGLTALFLGARGGRGGRDGAAPDLVVALHPEDPDPGPAWRRRADLLRGRAMRRLMRLEEDAEDRRLGLSPETTPPRDFIAERAAVLAELEAQLAEMLEAGLEAFPEAQRARIRAARQEASRDDPSPGQGVGGGMTGGGDDGNARALGRVALVLTAAMVTALTRPAPPPRKAGPSDPGAQDAGPALGGIEQILAEAARDSLNLLSERARVTARQLAETLAEGPQRAEAATQAPAVTEPPRDGSPEE